MRFKKNFRKKFFSRHKDPHHLYKNSPPKYSPPVLYFDKEVKNLLSDAKLYPVYPVLKNPHRNYPFSYKGQIHTHSNYDPSWRPRWMGGEEDDGNQTPEEVAEAYRDYGYKFICLTGHSVNTPDPDVPGIIHIRGVESGYACCHHLLGLDIGPGSLNTDLLNDTCGCNEIQGRINWIRNRLGIAVIAHPQASHHQSGLHLDCGSGWSSTDIRESNFFHGIEIFNSSLEGIYSWNVALNSGKLVWGFGSDDCHNVNGNYVSFNRSWIVVNSNKDENDENVMREDIIQNIKAGNFYSVQRSYNVPLDENTISYGPSDIGPELRITISDNIIKVVTDRDSVVSFVYKKKGIQLISASDYFVCLANTPTTYELDGSEDWVRVHLLQERDNEHYQAVSQPLYSWGMDS